MSISKVRAQIAGTWYDFTYNSSTGKYTLTKSLPTTSYNQPNHYYNVTVEATDDKGAVVTKTGTDMESLRLVVKEKTAPVITVVSPASQYLNTRQPTLVWTVTDEAGGSGIQAANITLKRGTTDVSADLTKTAITNGFRVTYNASSAITGGTYTYTLRAVDNDGNVSENTKTYTLDDVPPTITLVSPPTGFINTVRPTVTFTVLDTLSGINVDALKVYLDNVEQVASLYALTPVTNGYSVAYTPAADLANGQHYVKVQVKDRAENTTTVTYDYYLDLQPPTILSFSPAAGYVTDNLPTFTMTAQDEPTGSQIDVAGCALYIDGVKQAATVTESNKVATLTFTPSTILSEGPHLVIYEARDKSGNLTTKTVNYTIDTVPPELEIVLPWTFHQVVDDKEVTFSGNTFDITSPPVYTKVVNNSTVFALEEAVGGVVNRTIPLVEGENYITLTAVDQAGLETSYELYMIRLRTDRAQTHIDNIKALLSQPWEDWTQSDRDKFLQAAAYGMYNYTDFNRVTIAQEFIQNWLLEYGYDSGYNRVLSSGPVFADTDIPTTTQRETYIKNALGFGSILPLLNAPTLPGDMEQFNFEEANAIEKVLVLLDALKPYIHVSYWMCGETLCGMN